ncbi:NADH-quinone oxidoreductase subunit D, partial [bacterium]|nr:NADH-quinone oxidoreductase subunit D [bacterium]
YAKVESSKGEYGYYIVSTGGIKPYRVSVRGPSLPAGLFLCHKHLPGMRIDDVALWMNTLQICAPDFDR